MYVCCGSKYLGLCNEGVLVNVVYVGCVCWCGCVVGGVFVCVVVVCGWVVLM